MQLHPGKKIQEELKDRGWTQRQFAFLLWKKVSEVNELIKWKRNITVQWDILLSHVLWTSRKYRLDLQNEYEYSLVESDFDMSKLPNIDQKPVISEEKAHKISEQEIVEDSKKLQKVIETNQNNKFLDSGHKTISPEWPKQEKKDLKLASHHNDNSNNWYKIDKDVDISKQKEKHPNSTLQNIEKNSKNLQKIVEIWKKNIPVKQNVSKLDSDTKTSSPEWQKKWEEKKDKYDRQKIYNPNNKFDSYFPHKEKKEKHWSTSINIDKVWKNKILDSGRKIISPEWQEKTEEKKDDKKDHHKHKEHIFRNF